MKKLIGLLIISLIFLALTGCNEDSDSSYVVDVGGANMFVDPYGRYSVIYPSDWYYVRTTADEEKRTTWHSNWAGDVALAIEDWQPNGPTTKTALEWAQENRDRLISAGHELVRDISPIVNANGNTGYEFTVRLGFSEWRIALFFNNLTEQFDLTFEYDVGNPNVYYLTYIIQNFKTTNL